MTDEQLYSEYLHGNNEAIDELLLRHKEGLVWFLFGLVKRYEDAEDLMMDTFALLLAKRVKFKHESSFKTWLFGIGRNVARNYIRMHRRELPASDMLQTEIPDAAWPQAFDAPDLALLSKERNKEIYVAMAKLKEEYKEVLYLLYFEQMDAKQIATVMKCSVKKVYNLTDRAKNKLKELLDESVSS